jgi:hypothetical protein
LGCLFAAEDCHVHPVAVVGEIFVWQGVEGPLEFIFRDAQFPGDLRGREWDHAVEFVLTGEHVEFVKPELYLLRQRAEGWIVNV